MIGHQEWLYDQIYLVHGSDIFDNIQAIQAFPVVDGGVLLRVSAVRTRIVAGKLLAGRTGSVAGLKTLILNFPISELLGSDIWTTSSRMDRIYASAIPSDG